MRRIVMGLWIFTQFHWVSLRKSDWEILVYVYYYNRLVVLVVAIMIKATIMAAWWYRRDCFVAGGVFVLVATGYSTIRLQVCILDRRYYNYNDIYIYITYIYYYYY
jgi:hypothetical protein